MKGWSFHVDQQSSFIIVFSSLIRDPYGGTHQHNGRHFIKVLSISYVAFNSCRHQLRLAPMSGHLQLQRGDATTVFSAFVLFDLKVVNYQFSSIIVIDAVVSIGYFGIDFQ